MWRLHLLELRPHLSTPCERGGVGDLADRVRRRPRSPRGVARRSGSRVRARSSSSARRTHRERLEPLVARRDQALDRLVAREERHDALLLGTHVVAREARQTSAATSRIRSVGLLLDRPEHRPRAARRSTAASASTIRCSDGVIIGSGAGSGSSRKRPRRGAPAPPAGTRVLLFHVTSSRSGAAAVRRQEHRSRPGRFTRNGGKRDRWPARRAREGRSRGVLCRDLGADPILNPPKSPAGVTGPEARSSIW